MRPEYCSLEQVRRHTMKVRSAGVILAVWLATTGGPVLAQGVVAPAPGPVVLSAAPQGAAPAVAVVTVQLDGPAPPGAPTAAVKSTDVSCPESGAMVPLLDSPPTRHRIPLEASWDNGLHVESPDGQFSLHVGGIGQLDTVWLIGPQSVFALPGGG